MPSAHSLDHVVLSTADLEAAMMQFANDCKASAVVGGSHPTLGTKNALVGIKEPNFSYIELLGPDPDNPGKALGASLLAEEEYSKEGVSPYHFAIRCNDLAQLRDDAERLGFQSDNGIMHMSRRTPDGKMLEWRFLFLKRKDDTVAGGCIPFFIDWLDCQHPSENLTTSLDSMLVTVEAPKQSNLEALLQGVNGVVYRESSPLSSRLTFSISNPSGCTILYTKVSPKGIVIPK